MQKRVAPEHAPYSTGYRIIWPYFTQEADNSPRLGVHIFAVHPDGEGAEILLLDFYLGLLFELIVNCFLLIQASLATPFL